MYFNFTLLFLDIKIIEKKLDIIVNKNRYITCVVNNKFI